MIDFIPPYIERFGWLYLFEELDQVPETERNVGGWGFSATLNPAFALELLSLKADKKYTESLRKNGESFLRGMGFVGDSYEIKNPFSFVQYKDERQTLLLHHVNVPGNACGLDLAVKDFDYKEHDEVLKDMIKKGDRGVYYSHHNVDSPRQRMGLLGLWLMWVESVEKKIKY